MPFERNHNKYDTRVRGGGGDLSTTPFLFIVGISFFHLLWQAIIIIMTQRKQCTVNLSSTPVTLILVAINHMTIMIASEEK